MINKNSVAITSKSGYSTNNSMNGVQSDESEIFLCFQSACWALVKSWLDVQVDMELARVHPSKADQLKSDGELPEMSESIVEFNIGSMRGPDMWPQHVLDQQPRDLPSLFQKLVSG